MMGETPFHCPKCGSNEVVVINPTPDKPESVSMDELPDYFGNVRVVPAVLRITKYRATCLSCGYVVEWMG